MSAEELLGAPHLSVITRQADHELARVQDIIAHKVLVDGRSDFEALFGELLTAVARGVHPRPKTLDLIGHATPGKSLLQLGGWVIDTASPTVTAFFRELADHDVLPQLGFHAVRLLGCQTADTGQGRSTICTLSNILGLEVFGTTQLIYSAHYDAGGFRDNCHHALVCASDLRSELGESTLPLEMPAYPRVLDVDALPSAPLIVREHPWPRRIATSQAASRILRLIRRNEGAQMPGLLASPSCEIALPAARPNWYHLAQMLLDGDFVRVYPDGDRKPGVVYPITDPHALRALVDELPSANVG
ncbi:MAG: hypothetical protein H0T89_35350 [Deltaproteobacteria bacterium]|nr:hypothetical protein [Deltaproteobacteria bacterium]MDQ3301299.1 hypothetical protein [Myxococcota bacterium]